MLEKLYPDDAIVGESLGRKGFNYFTWIIDPIDGTKETFQVF